MKLQRHHVNTAIYLSVSMLGKAAAILLIPIYTSRLSRAEYGSYGLALTLFTLIPPLLSLSLGSAMARFFFDYRDPQERDQAMGSIGMAVVTLSIAGALVGELVLLAIPDLVIGDLGRGQFRLILWTCACLPITELPAIFFRASERAAPYAAIHLANVALTAGSTAYLMLGLGAKLDGLLGGMLCSQGPLALYSIAFTLRRLRPVWKPGLLREAIAYSVPFIPHVIGNSLMVGADRWALEHYGLREDLGLYTLAMQLTMPISLATSAWNEASSPRFLSAWRDGGDAAARATLPRIAFGFVACGLIALSAIVLGFPLLRLFVGQRFQPAFSLIPWVGLSLVIGNLFSAFINVLFLRKTTRIIPLLTLASVAVNVLLNVVLVPRLGVWGAILGTGVALTFRTVVMLVFALRALRRSS